MVKLVIIDNGSKDNSLQTLNAFLLDKYADEFSLFMPGDEAPCTLPRVSLLSTGNNLGYACGNNKGMELIRKDESIDKVMILNNDILFTEEIIPRMSSFLDNHQEAAIVSPLLLKRDGKSIDYNCARRNCKIHEILLLFSYVWNMGNNQLQKARERRQILKTCPGLLEQDAVSIELPSGSCMLVDKEFFLSIGCFDEGTFLYYEENILYKKILPTGKKNYILPNLKCIHLGAETTSKEKVIKNYESPGLRSAYYYLTKYERLSVFQWLLATFLYRAAMFRRRIGRLYKK